MSENESNVSTGFRARTRFLVIILVCLNILALIISCAGIFTSLKAPLRLTVYICQALACISIIIYAIMHFHKHEAIHFKRVVYSYAMLEVMRVALLGTNGIQPWASIAAKALLAILACNSVFLAQHLDERRSVYISMALVSLETLLYLIFFFGFPGMRSTVLLSILPLTGILISFSIFLFDIFRLGTKFD